MHYIRTFNKALRTSARQYAEMSRDNDLNIQISIMLFSIAVVAIIIGLPLAWVLAIIYHPIGSTYTILIIAASGVGPIVGFWMSYYLGYQIDYVEPELKRFEDSDDPL